MCVHVYSTSTQYKYNISNIRNFLFITSQILFLVTQTLSLNYTLFIKYFILCPWLWPSDIDFHMTLSFDKTMLEKTWYMHKLDWQGLHLLH